jgi:hypothetical protein
MVLQPAQPKPPFGPLARATSLSLLFLCRVDPRRQLYLIPFSPFPPDPCTGQPNQPGQRRRSSPTSSRGVESGRAARPARTPRTGARVGREATGEKGNGRHCPPQRASEAGRSFTGRATCPGAAASQGHRGVFPSRPRGADSKGGGRRGLEAKPTTPSWGFLFHRSAVFTGLKEKAGAPSPRRAVGERSGRVAAATRRTRGKPRTAPGTGPLRRQGVPSRARRGKDED